MEWPSCGGCRLKISRGPPEVRIDAVSGRVRVPGRACSDTCIHEYSVGTKSAVAVAETPWNAAWSVCHGRYSRVRRARRRGGSRSCTRNPFHHVNVGFHALRARLGGTCYSYGTRPVPIPAAARPGETGNGEQRNLEPDGASERNRDAGGDIGPVWGLSSVLSDKCPSTIGGEQQDMPTWVGSTRPPSSIREH